jgi:hypothetical protein
VLLLGNIQLLARGAAAGVSRKFLEKISNMLIKIEKV